MEMVIVNSTLLDGKVVAQKIETEIQENVQKLYKETGKKVKLATVLVGDNPASITYVNMKLKACQRVGIDCEKIEMNNNSTTEEVIKKIHELNNDQSINGILVQHPLPLGIDEGKCLEEIDIRKDVDGLNSYSFGKMSFGFPAFSSATPLAIMEIIKYYNIDVSSKHVVVVGRSNILGKPIAMLLLNQDATVTITHSKTKKLPDILKTADIVVAAVGKPKFIQKEWLKTGVIIIDAGYNKGNIGDVDLENAKDIASMYTPVPGGVGPVTISCLLKQTVESFNQKVSRGDKNVRI